jgi:ornithine carbamoyltransferase
MTALATRPRRLLGVDDLAAGDFDALLDLAAVMRRHHLAWRGALEGRTVACLFEEPSTPSRVSLEVAIVRLGAQPVTVALEPGDTLADTARVLSAYCDAIAVRTRHHRDLLELVEHATVPVVNVRTDRERPCRALADCLTLRDRFGALDGLPVAFVGAGDAIAYSLIEAAMLSGLELRIAGPGPDAALLARAGENVQVFESRDAAVRGAVAVHDDVWRAGPSTLGAEQLANLLPLEQAVLRALVTGDWES